MRIRLGLHLDGQRGWHPANQLGKATLGPMGLLGMLETQLGLLKNYASQSERIVQYRNCLKRCDSPDRFYHRTFATDELGTAATLLGWRDLWHLHGWNGNLTTARSRRLQDLSDVEIETAAILDSGIGERLSMVSEAMVACRSAIDEIELLDPMEAFPRRWQDVLAQLPCHPCASAEGNFGSNLLGDLQRSLFAMQNRLTTDRVPWRDDGSLVVAQAETHLLGGRWLTTQLNQGDTLLVATAAGSLLDGIGAAADAPRQGLRESSAFRPTLQVLPLALEILWEPLNFYGLLQFLTHPVCPVPGFARRKLAGKLAAKPGIGGADWAETLNDIDKHYGDRAADIRETIQLWVEHPRHSQDNGAFLPTVLERVERLVEFFRVRLGEDDRAKRIAYNAGFSQCRACAEALRGLIEQDMGAISPRQLQKLVAQATARGSENPLIEAQVGAQSTVTDPAAAIECFDRVVWWQMAMPAVPDSYPWSSAELEDLSAAGIKLPPMDQVLERTASEWLRPLLAAREQLVLLLPPKGEEVHPAWLMVEAAIKGLPVIPLDMLTLYTDQDLPVVIHSPLPLRKRWWKLPEDIAVPSRETESFSSLELFLFNPFQWLLRYPAKLEASRILEVSNDFLLFGNLAHDTVEHYYQQADALAFNDERFLAWFDANFDRIIEEEGAVLLMPGRRSDLEGFRIRLRDSMQELRRQIRDASVIDVQPELKLEGHFRGGNIVGFADLVLERKGSESAIVDMKWSGAKKYPAKLRQNRALQLAIYGELFRQAHGAWPKVAYYILDRAELFATDSSFFPSTRTVIPESSEGIAELWMRFHETWSWRRKQADAGLIEVVLDGVPEDDDSVAPADALAIEPLDPRYNEFLALAGWEE